MNNSASGQPGTSANGEESRVRVFDLHADTIGLQLYERFGVVERPFCPARGYAEEGSAPFAIATGLWG